MYGILIIILINISIQGNIICIVFHVKYVTYQGGSLHCGKNSSGPKTHPYRTLIEMTSETLVYS